MKVMRLRPPLLLQVLYPRQRFLKNSSLVKRFLTIIVRVVTDHKARGTQQGPPLVHKIYEPSHHADFAFQRAAAQGVRAHHWKFGNMPKIESVTPDDVTHLSFTMSGGYSSKQEFFDYQRNQITAT